MPVLTPYVKRQLYLIFRKMGLLTEVAKWLQNTTVYKAIL